MFEDDTIRLPRRRWFSQMKVGLEEVAFLGLVVLSVIGESVSNYSPIISFWYWLSMIPVFAATAIATEWSRARAAGQSAMRLIGIQVTTGGARSSRCSPPTRSGMWAGSATSTRA